MRNLIGKKATFTPDVSCTTGISEGLCYVEETTGKVVYVNEENNYFRVEYEAGGDVLHECFKFSQIGKDVDIHG